MATLSASSSAPQDSRCFSKNTQGRSFCADTENRPHVFLEYEFDIDAATGAILEFDADLKD